MADLPQGALMDSIYRKQRLIYDATRKYYLLGRDEMINSLTPPENGTVLEVACGTGRNLIKTGQRYPTARLFGLDISSEMLITARTNIARAGMSARTQLQQADACDFDAAALFGQTRFDRVFLSYSLSMIPDWQAALSMAASKVAPGGQLAVVDFGQQTGLPRWFNAGLLAWLAKFHVAPRGTLPEVLGRIGADMGGAVTISHPFRDYAVQGRLTLPS
ncbi:class I SAM-dependent methyltransferase [Pseudoruegeria sp. SK021]|uniref:class I SAM-dependent methyltransferase n=1 Tax=Pseudoruegeria sp. SK021 TaxID=1933035 RepID=UPI000A2206A3|nr:class I SAM-dependent methyltransferase [Pseudoruegeria sp. SK021]OSP54320.1 SAM-dependent methyltransferase [Pseudoruegeria sp. SK021]